ncbi:unnamed protein product, partial [Polarella glacialis]
ARTGSGRFLDRGLRSTPVSKGVDRSRPSATRGVSQQKHQRHQRKNAGFGGDGSESEASEPCPFEDEEEQGAEASAGPSGGWRWPKITKSAGSAAGGTSTTGVPARRVAAGGNSSARSVPHVADLSLAARLEHLRASANLNRSGLVTTNFTSEDGFVDQLDGRVQMLESTPLSPWEEALHRQNQEAILQNGYPGHTTTASVYGAPRSHSNTPRRKSQSMRRGSYDAE